MRYLITGGAGFIGSHLADHLLARAPDTHVTLLDNLSTGRYPNVEHLENHPRVKLLIGSVMDEALLETLIRQSDSVFHLASAVGVKLILEKPVQSIETIVRGTNAVLTYANRYRTPVLITSTSEVYGTAQYVPIDEKHPLQGQSPYSASKIGADVLVVTAADGCRADGVARLWARVAGGFDGRVQILPRES